jgi:hypothetical protein
MTTVNITYGVSTGVTIAFLMNTYVYPVGVSQADILNSDILRVSSSAESAVVFHEDAYDFVVNTVPWAGTLQQLADLINLELALPAPEIAMQLAQTIKVVASLPVTPEPGVTYLVGSQDTITLSGLNGNADKQYKVMIQHIDPVGNDGMTLRFNGVATNSYDSRYAYPGSTVTTTFNNASRIELGTIQGSNSISMLDIDIMAETGTNRILQWQQSASGAAQATFVLPLQGSGVWKNNSTNVTSLRFGATVLKKFFAVGTIVYVYRLN